ncbi:hypothetical protein ACLOJK_014497 [Asimina triloba]
MSSDQASSTTVSKADFQPDSPSSQYISSSALSLTILGIFESEIPIDDSAALVLLRDEFLPINPRFSSTLQDYLANIALEQLPDEGPLWEVHVIKYPTSDAL